MIRHKKLNMGGIKRGYFVDYLESQGANSLDGQVFTGDGWRVEVSPETYREGEVFKLPRVDITFFAEENFLEVFVENFRKNFLRGGG